MSQRHNTSRITVVTSRNEHFSHVSLIIAEVGPERQMSQSAISNPPTNDVMSRTAVKGLMSCLESVTHNESSCENAPEAPSETSLSFGEFSIHLNRVWYETVVYINVLYSIIDYVRLFHSISVIFFIPYCEIRILNTGFTRNNKQMIKHKRNT